jgi:hypothetical protein
MAIQKFWTIFGGGFLAAGLIALFAGGFATYHAYNDAGRLAHEGQIAEGIVLERKIEIHNLGTVGAGSSHNRPTEFYRLVYRFTTADGQSFTDEAGVDRATWDRLVERSPVRVIYVPGAPGINALAGHEPEWIIVLVAPLFGLVVTAAAGFLLLRARRRRKGALVSGKAAARPHTDRAGRRNV